MNRNEVGLTVFTFLAAAAFLTVLFSTADALGQNLYWNVGANEIQWTSGPGLYAAIVTVVWGRWHDRCRATRPCVRRGVHPVAGTTKRVCHNHHTVQHHERVHDLHAVEDGVLAWGETHGRLVAASAERLFKERTL